MDLGAPPLKTFFVITLPIIAPALVGGWLLAFTLSLDDLVIASFTTGPGATTLPMRIYSSVRLGVTPEINAVCTVLIALVTVGVIIASIVQKRGLAVRRTPPGRVTVSAWRQAARRRRTPRPWRGSARPSRRARSSARASAAWRAPPAPARRAGCPGSPWACAGRRGRAAARSVP